MSIALKIDDAELCITNVYIPPVNSIGADYLPSIAHLLNGNNHIVLGDFNAHHPSWHSALPNDPRGNSFADEIEASDYVVINEEQHTRITANCNSSPDITIISDGMFERVAWQTAVALSSDHLPIHITVEEQNNFIDAEKRTYINFNKANWEGFAEYIEMKLSQHPIPSDSRSGEKTLRTIITDAAKRYIPAGRRYCRLTLIYRRRSILLIWRYCLVTSWTLRFPLP